MPPLDRADEVTGPRRAGTRPPSSPDLSLLLRALRLEVKRGRQDDAIEGGFSVAMVSWLVAAAEGAPEELAVRLRRAAEAYRTYPAMSEQQRADLCAKSIRAFEIYAGRYRAPSPPPLTSLASPLSVLRGVGPRRAEALGALGLHTIEDLLRHYPLRYDDRRANQPLGAFEHRQTASLKVTVCGPGRVRRPGGRLLAEVPAECGGEGLSLVWFNQPYMAGRFAEGAALLVTGQVMIRQGLYSLSVAECEALPVDGGEEDLGEGTITPIYAAGAGVAQTFLRRLVREAFEQCEHLPESVVPEPVAASRELGTLSAALQAVHLPQDMEELRRARARISYEELFLLQAALATRRLHVVHDAPATGVEVDGLAERFGESLPFAPTAAQVRVIADMAADLGQPRPANRLIHGDVGAGKTVCAAFALLAAAAAGRQAAIMAPTELLAEQHHRTLNDLLAPHGIVCRLLVGSMGQAAKNHAYRELERGERAVVVGTHALFQERVRFSDLAVVVVDEQHRFGVKQRAELASKGLRPNVFVMSATPIPRTLALTAYGDFDVSVLDQLPPGRRPVQTVLAWGKERRSAYETLAARVANGRQAYVVCPLIDGGDETQLAGAEREFNRLRAGDLACFRLGLLHGRIDSTERDELMEQFRAGRLDILVATTVIEVGVDVPNATVMLVENAERFGLAQLHQLRGRVARGEHEGLCVLLTRARSPEVTDRLQELERTADGFEIAEEDLRRRGPGELTGTRQSGLPELKLCDLTADTQTLVRAREDAFGVLEHDPQLAEPEHAALRTALDRLEQDSEGWAM